MVCYIIPWVCIDFWIWQPCMSYHNSLWNFIFLILVSYYVVSVFLSPHSWHELWIVHAFITVRVSMYQGFSSINCVAAKVHTCIHPCVYFVSKETKLMCCCNCLSNVHLSTTPQIFLDVNFHHWNNGELKVYINLVGTY